MFWTIQSFPRCTHHVFLSHCAEDREALVHPLHTALAGRGIRAWLDRHDYPYGRTSRAALRDSILACRHVVFLVTDSMLMSARGWCVQELAWAELLQDNLTHPGGSLLNVVLPLYDVEQSDPRLPRSVWQAPRDRAPFCPAGGDRVGWAAAQIEAFLRGEQRIRDELARYHRQSDEFRLQLRGRPGLRERVTRFDPGRLPTADRPGG